MPICIGPMLYLTHVTLEKIEFDGKIKMIRKEASTNIIPEITIITPDITSKAFIPTSLFPLGADVNRLGNLIRWIVFV